MSDNRRDDSTRTEKQVQVKTSLAWLVWGLAAAYFFCDYFARVSPGVMSHQLQVAFQVSAAGLGGLSAYFYYPYVFMQIPVGLMVDRFSTRYLLTVMSVTTAVGCIIFGMATTLSIASFGRALIGFSAAFAFVSALRLAATWFPPARLGLLAGLTQALGMLGAAVGEAPVSYVSSVVGWRWTMFLMAACFVILSLLIYRFVQDRPAHARLSKKKIVNYSVWRSLATILSNSQTWFVALYVGLLFTPTAVFGEFWGPAYLNYGVGLGPHASAFADGMIFIGWGVGGPLSGWLSDRLGCRKPLLLFSAFSGAVIMSIIMFQPHLGLIEVNILLFLFGLTNTGVAIGYAVATEINTKRVVGTSIAFANMSSVIVGAFLQPVVGKMIDWHVAGGGAGATDISRLSLSDFRYAMWILPLCSLLAFICALFIKETHCTPVDELPAD